MDLHKEFERSIFFHQARIDRRSADALVGITAGLTADGKINQREAEFLKTWIETHLIQLEDPVVNILYQRLANMLSDGVLDEDESNELLEMLHQFSGLPIGAPQRTTGVSSLPLNDPVPELDWQGRVFLFTGVMAYGPRKDCESLVLERGGVIGNSVSKKSISWWWAALAMSSGSTVPTVRKSRKQWRCETAAFPSQSSAKPTGNRWCSVESHHFHPHSRPRLAHRNRRLDKSGN